MVIDYKVDFDPGCKKKVHLKNKQTLSSECDGLALK